MINNNYCGNDVKTLTPGQGYRQRIGMYLSADLQEAMDLALRELVYNAQDEFEATKQPNAQIKITINTISNEIVVEDNLRGIPCEVRDDGINSLTAACLIPHSGAKYDDKTAYASSVGCNGQGLKIVCHTAAWLKAEIKRDGKIFFQSFHETNEGAVPDEEVKIIGTTNSTGTKITYVPSLQVYGENTRINIDVLSKTLKELSYFSRGFKIILNVDGKEQFFLSENGLVDGLNTSLGISKPFQFFYKTDDCEVELALQWVAKNGQIRGYANGLEMVEGGKFITSFKSSLTRTFNSLAKTKFNGDSIRNILDGYVSVKVRVGQFSNQAKTSLANPEAGTATSAAISNCLKEFATTRKEDFNKVIELLTKLERAEKAADRAREAVLNQNKEIERELKKKLILEDKLVDCRRHDETSQLMLCEGHSARGALVKARSGETTACFELKGKPINVLKNSDEKVMQNDEVKALHIVLGCGIGDKFNIKKLRYGKIVIMADMDKDGYDIVCLLLTFFYKMYPQLLTEGKIYWGITPLFKVITRGKTCFAYSEEELKTLPPGEVTRLKGLGESTPSDFRATIFSDSPRMVKLTMKDAVAAAHYFDVLLGNNIEARKEYVFSHVDFESLED